jgi:hypothetical protein
MLKTSGVYYERIRLHVASHGSWYYEVGTHFRARKTVDLSLSLPLSCPST